MVLISNISFCSGLFAGDGAQRFSNRFVHVRHRSVPTFSAGLNSFCNPPLLLWYEVHYFYVITHWIFCCFEFISEWSRESALAIVLKQTSFYLKAPWNTFSLLAPRNNLKSVQLQAGGELDWSLVIKSRYNELNWKLPRFWSLEL